MNLVGSELRGEMLAKSKSILENAWRAPGYCVPNSDTYPYQWLWDSCFHSLAWLEISKVTDLEKGETQTEFADRAVLELKNVFANQDPITGFVPHMNFWDDVNAQASFWGRSNASCITQPPMFGHVSAVMRRQDVAIPEELLLKIEFAFTYLLTKRDRTPGGLVPIYHPWESGCDDSPRWDSWRSKPASEDVSSTEWRADKARFVSGVQFDENGSPSGSAFFSTGSVGFNALLAFNLLEFLSIPEVKQRYTYSELSTGVQELVLAIASRWNGEIGSWVDDPVVNVAHSKNVQLENEAGNTKTNDSLLALLVDPREEVFAELLDCDAFAAEFGSRGVSAAEVVYDPNCYWRGSSWPQVNYLLIVAAQRAGNGQVAKLLKEAQIRGASSSGFSEHWNPENGQGLGASPQTWSTIVVCGIS